MWNLWVVDSFHQPLASGACCDSQVKAYVRAGKFLIASGSRLEDLQLERCEVFGEKTLLIKDPAKDWGIATLEAT